MLGEGKVWELCEHPVVFERAVDDSLSTLLTKLSFRLAPGEPELLFLYRSRFDLTQVDVLRRPIFHDDVQRSGCRQAEVCADGLK